MRYRNRERKAYLPSQYLGDAPVGDPELPADVAGPDPLVGQLHYPLPDHVRQGPAVHEHAAQLVHAAVACKTNTYNISKTYSIMTPWDKCISFLF
ncbi:hypothetical protein CEXT_750591 [Caerostris extrusa]|uniref:Uncharacterized protein n=1 Tax=Caerostris extrusa TaxID=172846 RepID=A0AAV4TKE5_CAEEX|nr:hypothetical protein CEXT_750591 [Caerostris extrusa]